MDSITDPVNLSEAILYAVAYADIFNQPVHIDRLQRFIPFLQVSFDDLQHALKNGSLIDSPVVREGDWLTLPGRAGLIALQDSRLAVSQAALGPALEYGARMGRFPFVRMVALTGALAVKNASPGSDFDYLVVAQSGRIWTCRLLILCLVRLVAMRGHSLCPNYFISTDSLELTDRSFFTARELAQMIPITGLDVYTRLRRVNRWADRLLPNASGPPRGFEVKPFEQPEWSKQFEKLLTGRSGGWLERWERERKIAKFTRTANLTQETQFSAERIQGHFGGYRAMTISALAERLERVQK